MGNDIWELEDELGFQKSVLCALLPIACSNEVSQAMFVFAVISTFIRQVPMWIALHLQERTNNLLLLPPSVLLADQIVFGRANLKQFETKDREGFIC